ncbi:MAG: MFS transporter [Chloroflexi bacterium]|nr:MFS transporter [Chloroflexota bacterium]MDA1241276.1 MFS transporter [Chloroflexota bacterium]
MALDTHPPRAGRREWIGLAILALPCLVYAMDLTVLHLAVPELSADLRPSGAQLLWIIDIYGFVVAGSLITMGTLGDRIGRRRMLFGGAMFFAVASVIAAFATSAEMLIASRALLGLAGATVAPSTLSLLRNMFLDPLQRTTAVAVWIMSFSVGGAIGPIVGGLMLEFFWWGSVFLLAVPVMILLLVLGPFLLPEYRDPDAGRPDVFSALLSLAAVLSATYGLKEIAQEGLAPIPVVLLAVGGALGYVFVRRQQHLADPLIDMALFRQPGFSASLATYASAGLVMFGGFLFIPQFLQLVQGYSPLMAGVWMLPWALSFIAASVVTPRLARAYGPATVMSVGLLVGAVGFATYTQLGPDSSPWLMVAGSLLFSLGIAPLFTLTVDLIVGSAPPEQAGAAAAVSETGIEFAGAFGLALYGSIGIAFYRRTMDAASIEGVSAAVARDARDTLGAAVNVASTLPASTGGELVAVASEAFMRGLHVTAVISAVGAVALSAFVWRFLRGAPAAEGGHG